MTIDNAVRARIQELLEKNHMNICEISLASGLTPSTLYDFMRGKTKHIQLNTLKQVCNGFGMTLSKFFDKKYFNHDE